MTAPDAARGRLRRLLGRTGRVVTGVNVLLNLSGSPRVPDPDVTRSQQPQTSQRVQAEQLQRQWANHQKTQELPRWRSQAAELGDQLRRPESAEHRPPERQRHDAELSRQPSTRDASWQGRAPRGRGR